ncbi:Protein CBG17961 [Caenorhabditis briggsae]|uniref:Protein CBG17961 n=1 Tax=Caenorhabditis briggsae TaxID=6238 RepID=A8XSP0_CAEBR|nr:Protein CBG17961 [Caenorhabditis briggsae]CAP35492.2 Protein CBG17961 [Caenorhabditis briggsae]
MNSDTEFFDADAMSDSIGVNKDPDSSYHSPQLVLSPEESSYLESYNNHPLSKEELVLPDSHIRGKHHMKSVPNLCLVLPCTLSNDDFNEICRAAYGLYHKFKKSKEDLPQMKVELSANVEMEDDDLAVGSSLRNRLEKEIKNDLSTTNNPHLELISFLEGKCKRMRRIVRLFKSQRHIQKLRPIDAQQHWNTEKMTREEHDKRFTRWDAAMAEACADDAEEKLAVLEEGGFVGIRGDEAEFCWEMCSGLENKVNKLLEYNLDEIIEDKFYYGRFSLADVLEMKSVDNDKFFEKKLTLPKGTLYRQLLLNLSGLAYYDVVGDFWDSDKLNDREVEKRLFKGIPFDHQGNPFNNERRHLEDNHQNVPSNF